VILEVFKLLLFYKMEEELDGAALEVETALDYLRLICASL
jgi:hypothetical protein